jgi:hypothetical protein
VPRDLGDVIDYFLPAPEGAAVAARRDPPPLAAAERPAALPIVALPIGERDVVRAAFAWNLAVEIARAGASATLLSPSGAGTTPAWPEPGRGPLGAEVLVQPAGDLGELHRAALDVAVERTAEAGDGGLVLVCVPPAWIDQARGARSLLRWVLLFASADRRDMLDSYALAKRLLLLDPETRVGITIHGARRIADAERAFLHLADVAARHLGRCLLSYGLLVDDLHVYRAIVSRRPIGLEHPQSRAARALRDVADLLLQDARDLALA